MNSLADNLVVTCHAIVDISKSAPINPSDEISFPSTIAGDHCF